MAGPAAHVFDVGPYASVVPTQIERPARSRARPPVPSTRPAPPVSAPAPLAGRPAPLPDGEAEAVPADAAAWVGVAADFGDDGGRGVRRVRRRGGGGREAGLGARESGRRRPPVRRRVERGETRVRPVDEDPA